MFSESLNLKSSLFWMSNIEIPFQIRRLYGQSDYRKDSLGLDVARFSRRNYFLTSMTAQAILDLREEGFNDITVAEVGMGSGINVVAACMAGATKVLAYEKDEESIKYAKKLIAKKGFTKKVEIIEGDCFNLDLEGLSFDVIVNENISPLLKFEPQMPIAKLFGKYSKAHTRYVPLGVSFRVVCSALEKHKEVLGEIRFDKLQSLEDYFILEKILHFHLNSKNHNNLKLLIEGAIISQDGTYLRYKDYPAMFLSNSCDLPINSSGEYRTQLVFGLTPENYEMSTFPSISPF